MNDSSIIVSVGSVIKFDEMHEHEQEERIQFIRELHGLTIEVAADKRKENDGFNPGIPFIDTSIEIIREDDKE